MDWTVEKIDELRALWTEGLSTSEIGKRLGVTKNAVVGKAHRLHLSSRPSPIRRMFRAAGPRPPRMPVARSTRVREVGAGGVVTLVPREEKPVELSNYPCKWPIGHPNDQDFSFCGERSVVGKPYCVSHCAQAYVKPKARTGEAA
jgi:GcrA cell cycle regulator